MNMPGLSCATEETRPMAAYDRPGYELCRYVAHFMETDAGPVPVIRPDLDKKDRLATIAVRCGIRRDKYLVSPGLYGIGSPDPDSDVLVTANYKLTFDHLRSALEGISAWILVLDTRGVNVWCAAGKKIFPPKSWSTESRRFLLKKWWPING